MKFLAICARGNSRSVALGWILKDILHQEAIAIGMEATSPETREMLYRWADVIIVVDQQYVDQIPEEYRPKTAVWHVGGDRFFRSYSPELLNAYGRFIYDSGLAPLFTFTENRPFLTEIAVSDPSAKFPQAAAT